VKDTNTLLYDGIRVLRQSDKKTEELIAPRSEEIFSLLVRYIKEIELFNSAYGLVGTNDTQELVIKHILDSLAPLGLISGLLSSLQRSPCNTGSFAASAPQIADAGSGAGLPGIPLAIALPECNFTLIERMGRRAGFLLNTKAVLELSNTTIEEGEIEKTKSGYFNLIAFRAFKPMEPKFIKTLLNACAKGGIIAAYKGRLEKIEQEMAQLKNHCSNWEALKYSVPFLNEERHLLVIRV